MLKTNSYPVPHNPLSFPRRHRHSVILFKEEGDMKRKRNRKLQSSSTSSTRGVRSRLRGVLPLLLDDVDDVTGGELGAGVVVAAAAVEADDLEELDFLDFFFFSWERGLSMEFKIKRRPQTKRKLRA